jgi:hypothetical protein
MRIISCDTLKKLDNRNKLESIDDIDVTLYRFNHEYNEKIIDIISRCVNLKFLKLYTPEPINNIGELAKLQKLIKYDVKVFREYTLCISSDKKNVIYVCDENNYDFFANFLSTDTAENLTIFLRLGDFETHTPVFYYSKIIKILPASALNVKFIFTTHTIESAHMTFTHGEYMDNLPVCLQHIKFTILYTIHSLNKVGCLDAKCNKTCQAERYYNFNLLYFLSNHDIKHTAKKIIDEHCCLCVINNVPLLTAKLFDIETDFTKRLYDILKLPFGTDCEIEIIPTVFSQ